MSDADWHEIAKELALEVAGSETGADCLLSVLIEKYPSPAPQDEEAVEKVARAIFERLANRVFNGHWPECRNTTLIHTLVLPWTKVHESEKEQYRELARAALRAKEGS